MKIDITKLFQGKAAFKKEGIDKALFNLRIAKGYVFDNWCMLSSIGGKATDKNIEEWKASIKLASALIDYADKYTQEGMYFEGITTLFSRAKATASHLGYNTPAVHGVQAIDPLVFKNMTDIREALTRAGCDKKYKPRSYAATNRVICWAELVIGGRVPRWLRDVQNHWLSNTTQVMEYILNYFINNPATEDVSWVVIDENKNIYTSYKIVGSDGVICPGKTILLPESSYRRWFAVHGYLFDASVLNEYSGDCPAVKAQEIRSENTVIGQHLSSKEDPIKESLETILADEMSGELPAVEEISPNPSAELSEIAALMGHELKQHLDSLRHDSMSEEVTEELFTAFAEEIESVLVTRHQSLAQFLIEKGIVPKDIKVINISNLHAVEDIKGKNVYGTLPLNLACHANSITDVSLNIPQEYRGKQLSMEEIEQFYVDVATYTVHARSSII